MNRTLRIVLAATTGILVVTGGVVVALGADRGHFWTADRTPTATPSRSATRTPEPTTSPARSPTATPKPSSARAGSRSPFTGLPMGGRAPKRVLAVKIDNVPAARPATGLSRADIVYVEPVEGGLARILAVFSSRMPATLGPVRSARESDIELLRQFGQPAFAYSGANSTVFSRLAKAPLYDVSPAHAGAAYFRGRSRPIPHNLYAKPGQLLARAPKASAARDIGFRFGTQPAGGRAATSHRVSYPSFRADFHWAAKQHRWRVAMDGTPMRATDGAPPGPATVVVQYTDIRRTALKDSAGNFSPYTESVGSGRALVLRNGRAYDARWSRPRAAAGTSFTTGSGRPMTFAPGQTWVVFAPR
ncbi:DUF3048 domain-containing protein [Actinopolymorpha singaporensis]|uniref:DUF3048 domain-containing protein n=1 Tax=Actinopolymorpha singaporensis TaxID=117157 RepID=A0A1H1P6W0_9ACTN|nr:DUF3048 domain-containing protein [Actinopolymorpha singaporensis]SDS06934.1 Protein of unknown function [Actinopolymorpha singaporensis]